MAYSPITTPADSALVSDWSQFQQGIPAANVPGLTSFARGDSNMDVIPEYMMLSQMLAMREQASQASAAGRDRINKDNTAMEDADIFAQYSNQVDGIKDISDPAQRSAALSSIASSDARFGSNKDVLASMQFLREANDNATKASSDTLLRLRNQLETRQLTDQSDQYEATRGDRAATATAQIELARKSAEAANKSWDATRQLHDYDLLNGINASMDTTSLSDDSQRKIARVAPLLNNPDMESHLMQFTKMLQLTGRAAHIGSAYTPLLNMHPLVQKVLAREKFVPNNPDGSVNMGPDGIIATDPKRIDKMFGNDAQGRADFMEYRDVFNQQQIALSHARDLQRYINGDPGSPGDAAKGIPATPPTPGAIDRIEALVREGKKSGNMDAFASEMNAFSWASSKMNNEMTRVQADYDSKVKVVENSAKAFKFADDHLSSLSENANRDARTIGTQIANKMNTNKLHVGNEEHLVNSIMIKLQNNKAWYAKFGKDPKKEAQYRKDLLESMTAANQDFMDKQAATGVSGEDYFNPRK
jgi:hypothetical protein